MWSAFMTGLLRCKCAFAHFKSSSKLLIGRVIVPNFAMTRSGFNTTIHIEIQATQDIEINSFQNFSIPNQNIDNSVHAHLKRILKPKSLRKKHSKMLIHWVVMFFISVFYFKLSNRLPWCQHHVIDDEIKEYILWIVFNSELCCSLCKTTDWGRV